MADNKQPRILGADRAALREAAAVLRGGGLVAVPTETVYGLAARADSAAAVAAIYRAKGRPAFNPLIVHVCDLAAAERLACFDDRARALTAAFWPGALTLVLPQRDGNGLAAAVTAGLPTVALRCPVHPVMQAVLAEVGLPLAAPSANRSGAVSPTSAAHVAASLGSKVGLIVDGGTCERGIESTIVALREGGWQVLRPGPIGAAQLAEVLGKSGAATPNVGANIEAPGQLAGHYSPGKAVRLNALVAQPDEFHIGFAAVSGDITLSRSGDLAEAATRLYACLHAGAASGIAKIAVAPIPETGLGIAINDRLARAAVRM
jgi:L-threonylcarbamoyladenylate synthase